MHANRLGAGQLCDKVQGGEVDIIGPLRGDARAVPGRIRAELIAVKIGRHNGISRSSVGDLFLA